MRRSLAAIIGLTLAAVTFVAAPASATTPYCGITWGSLIKGTKAVPGVHPSYLVNVRAGQHTCYDRVVIDLSGAGPSSTVKYVDQVLSDPRGDVVPLRGGAKLEVTVFAPDVNIDTGQLTYKPANRSELVNVTGFRTLRQLAYAGGFEGVTTIGAGVRARLPFRVFLLAGPGSGSRLVIDVAHAW